MEFKGRLAERIVSKHRDEVEAKAHDAEVDRERRQQREKMYEPYNQVQRLLKSEFETGHWGLTTSGALNGVREFKMEFGLKPPVETFGDGSEARLVLSGTYRKKLKHHPENAGWVTIALETYDKAKQMVHDDLAILSTPSDVRFGVPSNYGLFEYSANPIIPLANEDLDFVRQAIDEAVGISLGDPGRLMDGREV